MSVNSIQTNTWLQQMPASVRQALDSNSDGRIDTGEVTNFLEQLLTVVKGMGTSYDATTGSAIVTKPTTPLMPGTGTTDTAKTVTDVPASGSWRDFVYGKSTSGNYAGVMVAPSRDVPAGYRAGGFRHQLEGFNAAKFDPTHPEGMTLKMVAARVFEQFDVYSDTAIDDVVKAFNEAGIPATKVGLDTIDFGNGEGPIDVIRNAAWLEGNKSAGLAWQWAPVNDGAQPMNFTMNAGTSPAVATAGGTGAVGGTTAVGGTSTIAPVGGSALYPGAVDQIDLGSVEWLHANVSSWPVTSKVTDVDIGSSTITIDHTKAGQWPTMDFNGIQVEGNPWVLVNRGGQWYGATYDWLRPGQTEKSVGARDIGENIKAEPLASWVPQPGELVGFMVSTPARTGDRTSNERTNVVTVRWPA